MDDAGLKKVINSIILLTLLDGNNFGWTLKRQIVGLRAAGQAHHVRSIVWMPIYWCLITMGTLKGLWQFFTKRHYWEKTKHGLSQYRA